MGSSASCAGTDCHHMPAQVHSLGLQAVWLAAPMPGHRTAAELVMDGLCAASATVCLA